MEREPASSWYRLQIRQSLTFGLRWTAAGIVALVWPLLLSLLIGNLTVTLVVYTLAILIDCVVFVVWLRLALRYSKRAARGESFELERLRTGRTQSQRG